MLHIINITEYQINVDIIGKNVDNLLNQIKDQQEYNIKANILQKKYDKLLHNLDLIVPKYKVKCGLINGLGTVI